MLYPPRGGKKMQESSLILEKIREDSEKEVERIIGEAKKKSEEIIKKSEKDGKKRYEELIIQGKKNAELEKQRIIANARLQAKKLILETKESIIEKTFSLAEKKLRDIVSSDEYESILRKLIEEAISSIPDKQLQILCDERDRELLRKIIKEFPGVELSEENISTIGGIIVKSKDGRIQVDNTFETRIERMRNDLRVKVARILFGGKE
ncbi:MAG: hypothetical protein DRN25_04975 [Thermoplasmata archaeon]|nr:MAG: hypothetical protein DRN25_04975 [Thermoplasmata archaeon]